MFPGEEGSNAHLLLLYFKIIDSPYNIYPFLTERWRVNGCTRIRLGVHFVF